MIQQSYNEIDGINFRADPKRFTHKTKKKDVSNQVIAQKNFFQLD